MSEKAHHMQPVLGWDIWRCSKCGATSTSNAMFQFGILLDSGECLGKQAQPVFDRPAGRK